MLRLLRESPQGRLMPSLSYKTVLMIGAVVDVALHSGKELVTAHDLADRLHFPRRNLEPVLQTLVRKGILVGKRGARGGYKLAKARGAISVYDISEAVKTIEAEEPSGLLLAVVAAALTQAEQCFASALKRITVEDLVHSVSTQMVPTLSTLTLSSASSTQTTHRQTSP